VIRNQFLALRDGDRFWHELTLNPEERSEVEGTRLSDIIRRNTEIGNEIGDEVFRVQGPGRPGRPGPLVRIW